MMMIMIYNDVDDDDGDNDDDDDNDGGDDDEVVDDDNNNNDDDVTSAYTVQLTFHLIIITSLSLANTLLVVYIGESINVIMSFPTFFHKIFEIVRVHCWTSSPNYQV